MSNLNLFINYNYFSWVVWVCMQYWWQCPLVCLCTIYHNDMACSWHWQLRTVSALAANLQSPLITFFHNRSICPVKNVATPAENLLSNCLQCLPSLFCQYMLRPLPTSNFYFCVTSLSCLLIFNYTCSRCDRTWSYCKSITCDGCIRETITDTLRLDSKTWYNSCSGQTCRSVESSQSHSS